MVTVQQCPLCYHSLWHGDSWAVSTVLPLTLTWWHFSSVHCVTTHSDMVTAEQCPLCYHSLLTRWQLSSVHCVNTHCGMVTVEQCSTCYHSLRYGDSWAVVNVLPLTLTWRLMSSVDCVTTHSDMMTIQQCPLCYHSLWHGDTRFWHDDSWSWTCWRAVWRSRFRDPVGKLQSAISTALQKQSWFCLCASLWEEEFTDVFVWREGQSKEVAIETTLSASCSLRQIMLFSNDSHWSKVWKVQILLFIDSFMLSFVCSLVLSLAHLFID